MIGDANDPFVPLPLEKLMFNLATSKDKFENLVDKIYNLYSAESVKQDRLSNQNCMGAGVKAGFELLKGNGKCSLLTCRWAHPRIQWNYFDSGLRKNAN